MAAGRRHEMETHFKEWAKPGVIPPGAYGAPEVAPNETLDAISGHFRIFQLRDGHRFSTDDVLTAWYGTTWAPSPARVLDLGAGIGSVGMIAAWRFEVRGDIGDYALVAARHLTPGGLFACVFPESDRSRVEDAARNAELTIVRSRPVVFREGEPPLIGLFAMVRQRDLPPHMR